MKLTWADVDFVETPGQIPFLDGVILITPAKIEIWKAKREAIFAVIPVTNVSGGTKQYVVGSYELPTGT